MVSDPEIAESINMADKVTTSEKVDTDPYDPDNVLFSVSNSVDYSYSSSTNMISTGLSFGPPIGTSQTIITLSRTY